MTGRDDPVVLFDADVVAVRAPDLADLRRRAAATPLRRARLCAHRGADDPLHEMLIVLDRDTYVRPHKHVGKTESFHVVEGTADVVLFDDAGGISDVIEIGEYGSGRVFYYRLNSAFFHTVVVSSSILAVHETTNGPFQEGGATFAEWSPGDDDPAARSRFVADLQERLRKIKNPRDP